MKKKSQTADAILKGIRRLELATCKTAKRYHSDNAKEWRLESLLLKLDEKGTQVSSTALHSSEQNAFVERRFGSLFAATKAALTASGMPQKYWSLTCLDAIDKSNFFPVKRSNGISKVPNDILPGATMNAEIFCRSASTVT
eukprot:Plantae.Rhodophyta-Palmaria_palmata.ctg5793.p1 GENE.Plantae.Rhodophyta-Palmaria_palmata.ctg5793~~Plantae.Rhodophyta-Palmaria_palmata.ctg5793.p1  ORF type:complete len:141 (+),score=5.70 Plantae.Rhodophyta-Palmaria_palmata.ctg5793:240-662(+)